MKIITNKSGAIVGTWTTFDNMNDITLAYNLGDLNAEQLKKVPSCYKRRCAEFQNKHSKNRYWCNPVHC